jgi:hypothetical protein
LKGDEGWLESLRNQKKKKLLVSFVRRQNTRAFYFHVEKAGRNFGFAHDVCPCSSMVGNQKYFPHFSPLPHGEREGVRGLKKGEKK